MADKKKSILDEALLDAKRIQEALNANSKEILASVTKEEIDSLVKESLEEDYLEEDVVAENDEELEGTEETGEEAAEEAAEETGEEETEDSEEVEVDVVGDIESSEEGDALAGDYESGMDALASDDEVEMDMTTASDDDVIAVYKKLTGDDEIEVVVDDEAGEVHLSVNEPGEFVIKTGEGEVEGGEEELEIEPVAADAEMDDMEDAGELEDESELMYEITLDEETKIGATANGKPRTANSDVESSMSGELASGEIEGQKAAEDKETSGDNLEGGFTEEDPNGSKDGHADHIMNEEEEALEESEELTEEDEAEGEEVEEQIRKNKLQGRAPGAKNQPKQYSAKSVNESEVIKKYNTLLTEAKELKGKNDEYKQALKQFRTMLAETVVFNSNLTYTTKLFMEHSTTKEEKEKIFKRFDNEVSSLKESKKLYKTIESELKNRKPLNESIENKIVKEVSSSKSTQLNESTAYVDKETSRIMDLMKRVGNR